MTRKRRFAIVLVAGAAIAVACGLGGYLQFAGTISSAVPQAIPGQFHLSLGTGQWEIYQLTGTQSGGSFGPASFTVTNNQAPSLTASMVTVTAPGGSQVPVQDQSATSTQTLQKGSDIYTGVASFQAPTAGDYSVSVAGSGASAVVVARPVLSFFRALLPWLAGGLLGLACVVVGLIGVIVAHRRHPQRPVSAP
jgi:hypothetical protein